MFTLFLGAVVSLVAFLVASNTKRRRSLMWGRLQIRATQQRQEKLSMIGQPRPVIVQMPQMFNIPVTRTSTPLSMYTRIALFALGRELNVCVDLHMPAALIDPVIEAVRTVYPEVRFYVLEYCRSRSRGRVLLWHLSVETEGELNERRDQSIPGGIPSKQRLQPV